MNVSRDLSDRLPFSLSLHKHLYITLDFCHAKFKNYFYQYKPVDMFSSNDYNALCLINVCPMNCI